MRLIDADALTKAVEHMNFAQPFMEVARVIYGVTIEIANAPSIDIVRCRECKYRPIKEDADGEDYGFNLIEPTEGDERCPCLVDDGWYSWMPKDDFYCGYGERKESE